MIRGTAAWRLDSKSQRLCDLVGHEKRRAAVSTAALDWATHAEERRGAPGDGRTFLNGPKQSLKEGL